MGKNISLIIAIIIAGLLAMQLNDPWRHISPADLYTAIISTDGNITPGIRQDFLINIFKEIDGQRTFESRINLGIQFIMPMVDGTTREARIPLTFAMPGKYTCSCDFPAELDYTTVKAVLYPDNRVDKPILTCEIPVKKERAIVVQPPANQVRAGSKVSFKLASVDKKNGLSIFKIPVRVKLIAPSGLTTLNRVVTTDSDGLANFETEIHPASPEGFYTFVFQSGSFEQKISIYVKGNDSEPKLSSLETIPTYSSDKDNNETCGYIFNLNCQSGDTLLAYGCPDSDHRQIEIWQNGKLHYFSNLDLEGGTVSLILQKPLLAGCPALFKVWQISGNEVSTHEKIRYIPPHNKNEFNLFLTELNSEFQNTEKDKLALALARKGYIGTSKKLSVTNLTKEQSQNLKEIYPNPLNEIPLSYYQDFIIGASEATPEPRFSIVDSEMKLKASETYKIYLSSKSFLESYINHTRESEHNLTNLLQEAICRVDNYNSLDIPGQNEELEALEGLLIPLSEAFVYLQNFPEVKKQFFSPILSTANRIKNITFIPAEFIFEYSKGVYDIEAVPMLNIHPMNRSFQSIQGLFKQTGKIQISNDAASETIDLNQSVISLPQGSTHITNLRSLPIVISW